MQKLTSFDGVVRPPALGSQHSTRDSGGPEASAGLMDMAEAGRLIAQGTREFAKSILHGDKAHKAWFLAAAEAFIAGKKPPKPTAKPRLTGEQIVQRYAPEGSCAQ
jgi:hypothetical protein